MAEITGFGAGLYTPDFYKTMVSYPSLYSMGSNVTPAMMGIPVDLQIKAVTRDLSAVPFTRQTAPSVLTKRADVRIGIDERVLPRPEIRSTLPKPGLPWLYLGGFALAGLVAYSLLG